MIDFKHVYFSYNDDPTLVNINFKIHKNEKIGIIGESGSGKTTLQKLITSELQPTQGELIINSEVLPVFQSAQNSFNPKLTIRESLEEALFYYKGIKKDDSLSYIKKELPRYNLTEAILKKLPSQLSGGELQRVNILRTIILKPETVICDEITSNLDIYTEREIIKLLNDIHKREENTLIIISHNIVMLSHVVNRIIVLHDKQIVDDFPITEIFSEDRHWYTKQLIDLSK